MSQKPEAYGEPNTTEFDLLTAEEMATLHHISRRIVEPMAWSGELPTRKVYSRMIRFRRRRVVAYVRANTWSLSSTDLVGAGDDQVDNK